MVRCLLLKKAVLHLILRCIRAPQFNHDSNLINKYGGHRPPNPWLSHFFDLFSADTYHAGFKNLPGYLPMSGNDQHSGGHVGDDP